MQKNKLKKIEKDILDWFIKYFPLFSKSFKSQINLIDTIEREFTGVGAFISFNLKNSTYTKITKDNSITYNRLDGLCIASKDFLHDVPISIEFENTGKIKYIEFEFGMLEKIYPTDYILKNC